MDYKSLFFLLVDDNSTMLALMMPMLQGLGYTNFIVASNGQEAWYKLNHEEKIHIILSDLIMPKVDGIELLSKVRNSEKFWDLPFVMITGEENQNQLMSSIEIDINSYIIKPFTPAKLAREISAVLKEKYDPPPYHLAMRQGRELLFQQNESEAALTYFNKAGALCPLEAEPYYFRAIVYDQAGKGDAAKDSLRQCIRLKEAHTKAHDLLALLLHREQNYVEEVKILNTIRELSPNNIGRNITLANAYAKLDDKDAVKNILAKSAKLARTQGKIHDRAFMTKIFQTYLQTPGLGDDAEGVYRKYIDRRMDDPPLLNRFAMILKENKYFDTAISFLKRIVNIRRTVKRHGITSDDMAVYYFNLAVVYIEKSRAETVTAEELRAGYEKARAMVDKALDCNNRHADAMKLLDWLDQKLAG
ncbi:MAG: response regulator [Deltaproteobacteria bacterium]|nr:response regulator [Deltaproteobacteria bacterium]